MKSRHEVTPAKAETGHFENPADAEALQAVVAAREAGEDPFGDNDEDAPIAVPQENRNDPEGDAGLDGEDLTYTDAPAETPPIEQQAAAPAPEPAPTPQQVQYKTRSAKEIADAQAAILTSRTEAFQKYSDGTMSADEYAKADMEAMTSLMTLAREGALQDATMQTALQQSEQALASVKALAATQGLNYDTDTKAATQFDQAAEILAKDPDMAKLPDAEFFGKVHNMVLFMRGVTPTAPAATGKPPARTDQRGPITLRDLPAAATPNAGGGLSEQLGRLNGLDFEEAVGRIPRSQRDQWLDS